MGPNPDVPVVLTIAGSDSSAGAGIQADLKTFSALGVYGLTAITCVVAEIPGKVTRIEPVATELVMAQIDVLLRNFPVAAIKTGLLYSAELIARIAEILARDQSASGAKRPLVIDPVMVATSGDPLLRGNGVERYECDLFPLATLVTPNMDEAAALVGEPLRDVADMRRAGGLLTKKHGVPFLIKGGHLAGKDAIDLLFHNGTVIEFSAPFSRGIATHGTGCTYSAAITAGLATGVSLQESIRAAKEYVAASIARHFRWQRPDGAAIHALNHSPNRA